MESELEILTKYANAREAKDEAERKFKEAKLRLEIAGFRLIEYMQDKGASATGKYDDVGWAKERKPEVQTNYKKEFEPQVFDFIRKQNMKSIIKLSVHPQSFKSFIGVCLDDGVEIPRFINMDLIPKLTLYKAK